MGGGGRHGVVMQLRVAVWRLSLRIREPSPKWRQKRTMDFARVSVFSRWDAGGEEENLSLSNVEPVSSLESVFVLLMS